MRLVRSFALPSMALASSLVVSAVLGACYVDTGVAPTVAVGAGPDPAAAPAPAPAPAPVEVTAVAPEDDRDDSDASAVSTFQPVLEPYGTWINTENGLVWVPNESVVGADFSPYVSGGHWGYTDAGYYWVSDYSWGWSAFHYGRWGWNESYGWTWAPGSQYSPAWVDWRSGGGYMGWRPAAPNYYYRDGGMVAVTPVYGGGGNYNFVSGDRFFSPHPSQVVEPASRGAVIISATTEYPAPTRVVAGRGFVGPAPATAGIPAAHVTGARYTPTGRPGAVAWRPAPAPGSVHVAAAPPAHVVGMRPIGSSPRPEPTRETPARGGDTAVHPRGAVPEPTRETPARGGDTAVHPRGAVPEPTRETPERGRGGERKDTPERHASPPPASSVRPPQGGSGPAPRGPTHVKPPTAR